MYPEAFPSISGKMFILSIYRLLSETWVTPVFCWFNYWIEYHRQTYRVYLLFEVESGALRVIWSSMS